MGGAHPLRPTRRQPQPCARDALLAEVRRVLAKALADGGTSFDAQYVNVNGASGYFAHSLNVYGRQGEACPRCGRPVVRETVHEPRQPLLPVLPAAARS